MENQAVVAGLVEGLTNVEEGIVPRPSTPMTDPFCETVKHGWEHKVSVIEKSHFLSCRVLALLMFFLLLFKIINLASFQTFLILGSLSELTATGSNV